MGSAGDNVVDLLSEQFFFEVHDTRTPALGGVSPFLYFCGSGVGADVFFGGVGLDTSLRGTFSVTR